MHGSTDNCRVWEACSQTQDCKQDKQYCSPTVCADVSLLIKLCGALSLRSGYSRTVPAHTVRAGALNRRLRICKLVPGNKGLRHWHHLLPYRPLLSQLLYSILLTCKLN